MSILSLAGGATWLFSACSINSSTFKIILFLIIDYKRTFLKLSLFCPIFSAIFNKWKGKYFLKVCVFCTFTSQLHESINSIIKSKNLGVEIFCFIFFELAVRRMQIKRSRFFRTTFFWPKFGVFWKMSWKCWKLKNTNLLETIYIPVFFPLETFSKMHPVTKLEGGKHAGGIQPPF